MKFVKVVSIFSLFVLIISACNSSPGSNGKKERFQPYPEETQILALTNAFRVQAQTCGTQQFPAVQVLTQVEAVGDTAWFHSTEMAAQDTENHVGASTVDRLKAQGFNPGTTVEHRKKTALPVNPEEAFNAWKADPVACADLMNPSFTVMGAGYAGHHDGFTSAYWTQILTTPQNNTAQPSLSLNPTTTTVTVGNATAVTFNAVLAGSTDTINWTLTGAGSISATTGATTNYTAPPTGAAGTATLTATAGALTASAAITINAAAPGLTITPATATSIVNGPDIIFKASSNQITWSMTGPGTFAWAGDTFTFKPGGVGTTVITASAVTGGLTATATVSTIDLSVSPITASIALGGAAVPFTAALTGSTATINWSLTGPGTISTNTGATTNYTPPATGEAGTATLSATVDTVKVSATISLVVLPAGGLQVEVKDLQRQALVPPFGPGSLGRHISDRPVAPMAANPNGGAYILWIRDADKKAFLTQVDGNGNVVGTDQDLGTAEVAGAVGTDGTKVAYLLKTAPDQLLFKVVGGGQTLLVNNSQPAPWPGGDAFGNTAMLKPVDFRRQAVVPVAGNWFTSFDHNNNFGTATAPDVHTGMSMVMLDGNGTNPTLGVPWGTSHSLDILALYDGTNILNVTVGDAFPQDFRITVLTPQGQVVGNPIDLFAKNKFNVGGQNIDSVPGNQGGLSSGKLGGLSDIGGGKFALSYLIQPSDGLAAKINEVGVLIFDKTGTAQRIKIKDGTGIKYVRSARYGANILVAWETTVGKFFAMVVDAQGTVIKAEQELFGGAVFSERDSFVNLSNGDVMWTASVGGTLKVYRLPAP